MCRIEILSILLIIFIRLHDTVAEETIEELENPSSDQWDDKEMLMKIIHYVDILDDITEKMLRKSETRNDSVENDIISQRYVLLKMRNYLDEYLVEHIRERRSEKNTAENVSLTNALRKHHTVTMDIWQSQKDILLQEFKHIMHQIIDRTNLDRQDEFQTMIKRAQEEKCKRSEDSEKSDYRLKLPRSCAEALKYDGKSGVYKIYLPESDLPPFSVYCLEDPMGDDPWLVMQRRKDGSVDFYRDWIDYKNGFGDLNGEFFLGLEKMHALTSAQSQELWIEMSDFSDKTNYAKYDSFRIGDENSSYKLEQLGKYSGQGNDSLRTHEGKKFTTKDSDNDLADSGNCATWYKGGWWYSKCHDSNLNGLYLSGSYSEKQKGEGINWFHWRGNLYSLKYVHMAIREKNK